MWSVMRLYYCIKIFLFYSKEKWTKAVYEKFDAKRVSLETEKLFLNDEESNNE